MSKLWLTLVTAMCCSAAICQTSDNYSNLPERDSSVQFSHFIVEKSADGIHFETLGAIGSGSGISDTSFSIMDNAVGTGMAYYRIRVSGENGNTRYSKTVSTSVVSALEFRFYPNPVDKLLIIRSSRALTIQVMDGYGIIWFNQDVEAGMQIINVSALQKGNYILKATDRETSNVISEQLIKN